MTYVESPFPGFKIRPKYSKIVTRTPVGGGRLFHDPNGRPADNVLAALYLGSTIEQYYAAEEACQNAQRYPGPVFQTDLHNHYDPNNELLYMLQQEQEQQNQN